MNQNDEPERFLAMCRELAALVGREKVLQMILALWNNRSAEGEAVLDDMARQIGRERLVEILVRGLPEIPEEEAHLWN